MTEKNYLQWLSESTPTLWWHDSAERENVQRALANGAVGMTTNPYLVASALYNDRSAWASETQGIEAYSGDDKALELEKRVTKYYCGMLRPVFDKGVNGEGGVCAQVNPSRLADSAAMIAQMKKIGSFAPNVFVKLPATKAGIGAFEEGVALGFNVAATLSFSVPQVVEVAEAQRRGEVRAAANNTVPGSGVAVLMVGRLDDYIRDVAADNKLGLTESEIRQCGIACMKKAYSIFNERGYKTVLMAAAARGTYHVTELAGARMILSVAPQIENLLLKENPGRLEKIENPVTEDVIGKLLSVREFAKAYYEDGMKPEDFITYGPMNRTLVQFVESGWNRLVNF